MNALSIDKSTGSDAKVAKKPKQSQNRRKSRELVLKAVYRGMLNTSEMKQIILDAQEDPDILQKFTRRCFKQNN
jgi:transcription antitermination protein NusB